jgi:hypothetical protein
VVNVFIYDAKTYRKIKPLLLDLERGAIIIDEKYCDVEVDY